MRISLGAWIARVEDGSAAAFAAYADAHQSGLMIDIDDLGCANDRTPACAWTGFDTDKQHAIDNDENLEVFPKQSGGGQ